MDISESGLCGFSPSLISVCCSPSLFSPPSSNPFIPSGVAKGGVKALRFAGTFFFGPPLQSHRRKHACTVVRLPAKLSTLPPSSYAIFPPRETFPTPMFLWRSITRSITNYPRIVFSCSRTPASLSSGAIYPPPVPCQPFHHHQSWTWGVPTSITGQGEQNQADLGAHLATTGLFFWRTPQWADLLQRSMHQATIAWSLFF